MPGLNGDQPGERWLSGRTRYGVCCVARCTCHLGQAFVICISSDAEKLRDTIASDWRDDAELGQMSADRVDH